MNDVVSPIVEFNELPQIVRKRTKAICNSKGENRNNVPRPNKVRKRNFYVTTIRILENRDYGDREKWKKSIPF